MAASDSRARCPTCQAFSGCGWQPNRQLVKPLEYPSTPEQDRRRARAQRLRRLNEGVR